MARLTVVAITQKTQDDPYIIELEEQCQEIGFSFKAISGSYEAALEEVAEWNLLPEVMIIECPDNMDAQEALQALGDVAPEGETETIITNVPNDIRMYRGLKSMGVAEVFADDPDISEVSPTLEAIATKEMRSVGIDPRRVVYVWSSCGGAGGTTFALSFAHHFAAEGRRTLVVDMDMFAAPVSYMYNAANGAQETSGLLDMLTNPERVDALFLERAIQKADDNLYYLSSRRRGSETGFQGEALSTIVARAQQSFDMVVVDTPWRAMPEPEWSLVNGPSYIVSLPTPQGLMGFATIVKELHLSPSKAPIIAVVNKSGEFKSNDINAKVFGEDFKGKIFPFPYDPGETGRLFFEQKTLNQMRGKARKPMKAITATLPARAQMGGDKSEISKGGSSGKKNKTDKKSGGFSLFKK